MIPILIVIAMIYCYYKARQTDEDDPMYGVWISLIWTWFLVLAMIVIWKW